MAYRNGFLRIITFSLILYVSCSSLKTRTEIRNQLSDLLRSGNFAKAAAQIEQARTNNHYLAKDRVLYYLDKGAVLHYLGEFQESNRLLEEADLAMEELFTRRISKAIASLLLNDNILDYSGEVYENIYVNIFKALNYLKLNQFEAAYVEIRRVNDKLREYDDKYGQLVDNLNQLDTTGIKISKTAINFYEDALAHYLSYLVFRAEGELDNSRISFQKARDAWSLHPDVYAHPMPEYLENEPDYQNRYLHVLAFTGMAPQKYAVGGKITTYDSLIHISDLSGYRENLFIPMKGIKQGYHFKFAFPDLRVEKSIIEQINVYIDGENNGRLQLLEDMGAVAIRTFEAKKNIIYFKTLIRTVVKGLASMKAKEKLRKEAKAENNFILGALINLGVDAMVDATENPDLRSWTTMPQRCYIGEFPLNEGKHHIEIHFRRANGLLVKRVEIPAYEMSNRLNLVRAICLN
ncbi:MAG: COG3014 family protein [Calditrichia bacterium]